MLPPSLFYFAEGYVETSYDGQAILDVVAVPATAKQPPNFWGVDRNVEL